MIAACPMLIVVDRERENNNKYFFSVMFKQTRLSFRLFRLVRVVKSMIESI